jgi:hypothetical protein
MRTMKQTVGLPGLMPEGWTKWDRFDGAYTFREGQVLLFVQGTTAPEGMEEWVVRRCGFDDQDEHTTGYGVTRVAAAFSEREAMRLALDEMRRVTRVARVC